nr:MAG TPA: Major capsid protein [Microviridae sp.]
MANVMSMKHLKNNVSRNSFDLSMRKAFTAKVGELLPVFCKEVLPGDKFNFKLNSFTRTSPVNSAAYTRIKEYYDYFFVPYRLLWRYFDQFITQTAQSNPQFASSINQASVPLAQSTPLLQVNDVCNLLNAFHNAYKDTSSANHVASLNLFGFDRSECMYKLMMYLGYSGLIGNDGTASNRKYLAPNGNLVFNPFPLLAYQKIYMDYFRDEQWETNSPQCYNIDYQTGTSPLISLAPLFGSVSAPRLSKDYNLFDLRYSSWNKDLFMGVLPSPQTGDTAVIGDFGFGDSLTVKNGNIVLHRHSINGDNPLIEGFSQSGSNASGKTISFDFSDSAPLPLGSGTLNLSSSQLSSISVLALRQAEALQKWKEISISGKQDYKDQIEKHFGVSVPSVRSNLCDWIGGTSSNLDISEVVNTNLQGINDSGSTVAPDIAGKGLGVAEGNEHFEASEHGLVLCLYHAVPLLDYGIQVTDPMLLKGSVYDYAIPEFDKIGMQPLPSLCLGIQQVGGNPSSDGIPTKEQVIYKYKTFGYVPRYAEYKTSIDQVVGAFSSTLRYWSAPVDDTYINNYMQSLAKFYGGSSYPAATYMLFKVNPHILDSIFVGVADSTYDSDTFLINSYHDIKVVRNLDRDGLPY